MTKKNVLPVLLAMGLAVVYVVWFTNWFRPTALKISYTYREMHRRLQHENALPSLIFRVSPQVRFTELKVVPLDEYQTNKSVLPVWHLISDSNSVPVADFTYGQFIRGMRPAVKGVRAEPLETNVTYRMFVTAGRATGQHDFILK